MATETLSFDILARDLASATFKNVGRSALDASTGVKELSSKLKDVSGRVATARVGLEGDKEAQAELDKLSVQLIRLGKKTSNPNIDLEGAARAAAQLSQVDLALDRLDHKHVTATVDVKVNRRSLSGLLSSLGGAGEGGGPLAGGLGSPVGIGAIVGGGAIAAGLVPSVVGLGLGGGVGLGAVAGGLFGAAEGKKQLNADLASIRDITTRLKGAVGQQKTILSQALKDANKQYSKDATFFQPFSTFQASIQGLAKTILTVLRPVMAPLAGIFTEFGKSLAQLGPQFTALFQASLPFVKQFLGFMLQAGKILLPAFTTAMNQMVKSGALQQMTQALVILTQGLADFIVALGPGMAASAQVFARVATFIARALGPLGTAFSDVAKFLTADWSPAHLWNVLLRSAEAFFSAVINSARAFGHALVSSFDALRHDIAAAWDAIWANTVGRARSGVDTVIAVFRTLPGRAVSALTGLGHSLGAFASAAMNEMWNGFRNVAGSILKWLGGFVSSIISKVKSLLHIGSPSAVFHDIGMNMMLGLERGIKAGAHKAANAARGAAQGAVAASGARTRSAAVAQSFAASILPRGWSMADLIKLWNQESGWSAYAVNPSSGAYGIPQSLGHGHPYNLGDYKAQIEWGINYIAGRYGNSQNAWAHEQAFNWYDHGGWLPPGLSLALNTTGRPEQVISGRGGTAPTVVINVNVPPTAHPQETARLVGEAVRRYTKGGGQLYPAGVAPR